MKNVNVDMNNVLEYASVFSIFGCDLEKLDKHRLYNEMLLWFDSFGRQPGLLGFNHRNEAGGGTGRMRPFVARDKKIRELGFLDLTSFEAKVTLPNSEIENSIEFIFMRNEVIISSRVQSNQIPDQLFMEFAQKLIELARPCYGIGYRRRSDWGPTLFATGILCGLEFPRTLQESEQQDNWSFWRDGITGQAWREGLMRDVYQWNFLCEAQLERQVDGIPLRSWISTGTNRGTLEPAPAGLTLWRVEEANMTELSNQLMKSGNLFHHRTWHNMPIENEPETLAQLVRERALGLWVD